MRILLFLCLWGIALKSVGHDLGYNPAFAREWHVAAPSDLQINASLYYLKDGIVYLHGSKDEVLHFPLMALSPADQRYVQERYQAISRKLNSWQPGLERVSETEKHLSIWTMLLIALLSIAGYCGFVAWNDKDRWRPYAFKAATVVLLVTVYGFTDESIRNQYLLTTTNPQFVDSSFRYFKPSIATHWDNTYFYIESKGMAAHEMMTGIIAWQQQVPIPQCYTTANNNNAWMIPLNPVMAATPVPVNQQHFLRGAIAVAVNGIPIFSPYTNTGVDAFLDGQLDNYGGHSGRADDYHYHIAPLHLYSIVPLNLPVAFALDGFAVYGSQEPDGTPMYTLDANHGHMGPEGRYHYHGSASAPYMIAQMAGVVNEDNTMQIIPQPAARPVRPSLTPLTGAVITGCVPNGTGNGYNLSYTRNGQQYAVNYSWSDAGSNSLYHFQYVAPGAVADSFYTGFSQSQCVVPGSVWMPGIARLMKRLEDTGEENDYSGTFGEDADYSLNRPYFMNNGNGTVTDTITGLMWQRSDGGEMTIERAAVYADTLTLAGFTDWRLPEPAEAFSILNMQFSNPAMDTQVFVKSGADYWWTKARQYNDSNKVWVTNAGGGIGNKPKTETISAGGTLRYHVRAVRNAQIPDSVQVHFTDRGDSTIIDSITGLIWQKYPASDSLTWEQALLYANNLSIGTLTEWRLPNIKELQSLVNIQKGNPAIDTGFLKLPTNKKCWSATTLSNHTTQAWYLQTRFGITSYDEKTARNLVFCVCNPPAYVFTGTGLWTEAGNWINHKIPPAVLPAGFTIIIDPVTGGQCVLNVTQIISKGAGMHINPGKNLLIPGYLDLH